MPNRIRFILALHNHQPIGNFDHVFRRAYQQSYLPFLDLLSRYESLKIALHVSGPLMEWLEANQPQYVDRLAELAAERRIEILGGAFYEPILSMIASMASLTRWAPTGYLGGSLELPYAACSHRTAWELKYFLT